MSDSEQSNSFVKAPHKPITGYYTTEAERASFVREMFDTTSVDYDRIEHLLALGTGQWYRSQALKRAGVRDCLLFLRPCFLFPACFWGP